MPTCLLIDDDPDDQEIFQLCIQSVDKNIVCTFANGGHEAIQLLSGKSYIPDYIFLDVNMPRMTGLECLAALRNLQHLQNSRMYMYSTTAEKSAVNLSKELGASDFIIKPSKTDQLKEKLAEIFQSEEG